MPSLGSDLLDIGLGKSLVAAVESEYPDFGSLTAVQVIIDFWLIIRTSNELYFAY